MSGTPTNDNAAHDKPGDPIRIGLLRLSDAAPVILAEAEGLFTAQGIDVMLSVEPSWANIADKLGYGLLEAAVMLPPLAIACALGLRGRRTDLVVPMGLSLGGNAVTLAHSWRAAIPDAPHDADIIGKSFKAAMAGRANKPVLAVVHGFSTHDLLLRHWLAAHGIDPAKDVTFTVLPPAEMLGSLAAGSIDGFCAGAPWGGVAAQSGLGFVALHSAAIRPYHAEKCLAVRADWVGANPRRMAALHAALHQAATLCAAPAQRGTLAALLAEPAYLNLPAAIIEASLDPAAGGPEFTPPRATTANPDDARWFADELARWGHAPAGLAEQAARLYQPFK